MIRTKIKDLVAEEMAQQVRAPAALLEDLDPFPAPIYRLLTVSNYSSEIQNSQAGTRHPRGAQKYTQAKQSYA